MSSFWPVFWLALAALALAALVLAIRYGGVDDSVKLKSCRFTMTGVGLYDIHCRP